MMTHNITDYGLSVHKQEVEEILIIIKKQKSI